MIDTRLVVNSAATTRARAHENNVIGTLNILAACTGEDSPVRRLVFKSSGHWYGCEQDDPAFFTEEMRRKHPPKTPIERDIVEAESAVAEFAEKRPETTVTILRCANVLGPDIDTPHTRMFALPMVPMILGFDPRYQFVHSDDVVHALEHAAFNELPGAFNVAADGVLALSEVIGLLGKRPLPILPPWGTGLLAAPLRQLGVRIPDEMLAQMRFGRGLDNRRFKATGFKYSYTSREAVLKLGEHQRLQPGPGRGQGALPLRARGRGVPALEPSRPPRRFPEGGRQGGRGDVRSLASGRRRLSPHARLHRPGCRQGRRCGMPKLSAGIGREALQLGNRARRWDARHRSGSSSRSSSWSEGRWAPTPTTTRARTRSPTAITVGGVEIGGLNRAEATALLHRRLVEPLQQAADGQLRRQDLHPPRRQAEDPRQHQRHGRSGGLDASHDGGLPGRLVRYVTGGSVDKQIQPEVTYSQPAINRFVRRVAAKIDRDPQDASVSPSGDSLNVVPGQAGRKVRDVALTERAEPRGHDGDSGLAHDQGRGPFDQAGGEHRRGGLRVPDLPDPRSRQLHPALLAEPEAGQDLHGRRRAAGPGDARPGSTTSRTSR